MSRRFDTRDPEQFAAGIEAAMAAVRRGELVVAATESVYGIGADAFRDDGVDRIRQLKRRGPQLPIPVLIGRLTTVHGITVDIGSAGQALIRQFWPGMLTIIARSQPALRWEVGGGERGVVSVRYPIHQVAWRLAYQVGPLAFTGANLPNIASPVTCDVAQDQFGEAVAVYLDSGPCDGGSTSTVVDLTGETAVLVREGAVSLADLRRVAKVEGNPASPPS